jgi:parallel beta-helix repeat protein
MKWRMISIVCVLLLSIFSMFSISNESSSPSRAIVSSYISHAPILIIGDSGFLGPNATTGISWGNGTSDNPYIIEGWDINASSANGIEISMATKYFIIRNCQIFGGKENCSAGIELCDWAQNGKIENCTITGNYWGIISYFGNNVAIVNNTFLDNMEGIDVRDSTNMIIDSNSIFGNHDGIMFGGSNSVISHNNITFANGTTLYLWYATDVNVTGNNISKSDASVRLSNSARVNFSDNNVFGTYSSQNVIEGGIIIEYSTIVTMTGNHFFSNGIYLDGDNVQHFNSHSITLDNLVNGLPIYYYKNLSSLAVDNVIVGQLLIANCSGASISNLTVNDTYCGIESVFSDGATLTNCTITNCSYGLYSMYSNACNILYNNFLNNKGWGSLAIVHSTSAILDHNYLSNNFFGIVSTFSTDVTFSNNTMLSEGISLIGTNEEEYNTHSISMDNLANGKPVHYLKNIRDVEIDGLELGELIIANCTGINVSNLQINNTDIAIEIAFSDNVNIEKCGLTENFYCIFQLLTNGTNVENCMFYNSPYAISSRESGNLTIKRNSIVNNSFGIDVYMTANVLITENDIRDNLLGVLIGYGVTGSAFHNNFINNSIQGIGYPGFWDNGYPDGGNYWSDYVGADVLSGSNQNIAGSDGIGDTPYSVDWNSNDSFPFMEPLNIGNKPFASFTIAPKVVNLNKPITVDASGSYDIEDDSSDLLVRWDWECNGTWTPWSIVKIAQHNYSNTGFYTVKMEIMDTDGFVSNTTCSILVVNDSTPPVTTVQLNGIIGRNGWYVSAISINCTSVDQVSGIDFTEYRLNNGSWIIYSAQLSVSIDGEYVMGFYSEDKVGNQESAKNVTFKIDCAAPISIASTSEFEITIVASDNTSGVNRSVYRIDGSDWKNFIGSFNVSTAGNHTIEYYSVDNAGNEEEIKTISIDNGPEITGIPPELLLLALLILIVAIILSLFYIRRKRGLDDESPP